MAGKPRILVIGMGGAISAKAVGGKWSYGEIPGEELLKSIASILWHFEITATNLFRMDSSDMKPENWLTLANTIYYSMKDYDGIVVTMGTDTLSYAASAIAFLIQGNNIPIVFTGSQTHPGEITSDARVNLRDALTIAGFSDIAEALVVFNGKIMRATRTKKTNASELAAFEGFDPSPLGDVQQFVSLSPPYRKRSNSRPVIYTKLETDAAELKVYPGFDGKRIEHLVDYGAKGIVLEGYGLGNIPLLDNRMKEGIAYANRKNVPIIIASNSRLGRHWKRIYEAEIGIRLRGLKVIPVYDMLPETAYVKLMWVLGQTNDYNEVERMMQKSYAGEIMPFENGKKRKK